MVFVTHDSKIGSLQNYEAASMRLEKFLSMGAMDRGRILRYDWRPRKLYSKTKSYASFKVWHSNILRGPGYLFLSQS